jgi:UDP-N-acetylglucosamine acyltransferase
MLASGLPPELYGPNVIGLRRSGFTPEAITALKRSYRIIFRSRLPLEEAIDRVRAEVPVQAEVETLIKFVTSPSHRGIMRRPSSNL